MSLRRVLALWRVHLFLDLIFVLRSPERAIVYIVSDGIIASSAVAGMVLLATRFESIGEWPASRILFLGAFGVLVDGVVASFFQFNVAFLSRRIGRGQLDHSLLQPQPLRQCLLTEGFAPLSGSGSVLTGIIGLSIAASGLGIVITPLWMTLLCVHVVAATAIAVSFSTIWATLAFWSPRGAEEVSSAAFDVVTGLKGFPLDRVGGALTVALLTVAPAGFVGWLPARVLTASEPSVEALVATPLAAVAFAGIAILCLRLGLRHYLRTGSWRYTDFGHRR